MSDIDLRNGVRITITAPAPRFTVSAPSSTVAVLPVRGPAGADGTGGTGGGVSDHGALTGLADDDHPHYALADGTRGNFATPGHTHTYTAADVGAEPAGAVAAHSADTTAVHGIADTAALVVTTDPRLSDARAPTAHTHPTAEVTGLDTALAGKADDGHLHDDRYYTETEVDTALAGKATTSHNHVAADVTDLGTAATKNTPATGDALAGQVVLGSDTRLTDARTPTAHTHPATGVTFTPTGNLAATDVQGALVELDAEKAASSAPYGKLSLATPVNYTTNTAVVVTFDTEVADSAGMVEIGTQPTRLTVTEPGLYLAVAAVDWTGNNTGLRFVNILKNGTPVATDRRTAVSETEAVITGLIPLLVGDYLQLQVYQTSGVDLGTQPGSPTLAAVKVST